MTTTTPARARIGARFSLFWLVLLLIALAEFLTAVVQPQAGLAMHIVILIGVVLYASIASNEFDRRLALGLMLLPMIRLVSLALPLGYLPRMAWYPAVAVPLLIAIWGVVRQNQLSRKELGLRLGSAPLQIALAVGGLGIGAIEYMILRPATQPEAFSWGMFLLSAINLLMFTGFTEELLFRALLQRLAVPVLGRWSIVYVSLLFGVMHIGYFSVADVLFIAAVGLLFAQIGRSSGSIIGVALAHGTSNIMLFLIMPILATEARGLLMPFVGPLVLISLLAFGIVGGIMHMQGKLATSPMAQLHPLRVLRREPQVTLHDLMCYTGIPARRIVAIELGIELATAEELDLLINGVAALPRHAHAAATHEQAATHQSH